MKTLIFKKRLSLMSTNVNNDTPCLRCTYKECSDHDDWEVILEFYKEYGSIECHYSFYNIKPEYEEKIIKEFDSFTSETLYFGSLEEVDQWLSKKDPIKINIIESNDLPSTVTHPDHYQSSNGIECWDAIAAATEGLTGMDAVDTGNIIKYAWRWKKKNGAEDIRKIIVYANHLLERLEHAGDN